MPYSLREYELHINIPSFWQNVLHFIEISECCFVVSRCMVWRLI